MGTIRNHGDDDGPRAPFNVVSDEQMRLLWAFGFTVIPRTLFGRDPYEIARAIQRPGMAQQWGDVAQRERYVAEGWRIVAAQDWPGLFGPIGYVGDAEINGLVLMQRPQHEVDLATDAAHFRGREMAEVWKDRVAADGFTAEVGEAPSGDAVVRSVEGANTIDLVSAIPRDMMSHVHAILRERDRLCDRHVKGLTDKFSAAFDAAMKANPQAAKWPTLRAIVMPMAVENVRALIKQEGANDGTQTDDAEHRPAADSPAGPGGRDPTDDAA